MEPVLKHSGKPIPGPRRSKEDSVNSGEVKKDPKPQKVGMLFSNIGALIIGIGFWGPYARLKTRTPKK